MAKLLRSFQTVMMCSIEIAIIVTTTYWQTVSSTNILESIPPSVNGVLTACAGQQISLTCSQDINILSGQTLWRASHPVNCSADVIHIISAAPDCGPFMFEGITHLQSPLPPSLNSTAVANATVSMANTTVECRAGNLLESFPVGNISLCIVGEFFLPLIIVYYTIFSSILSGPLPPPTNLLCMITPRGLNVTWEPVTDNSCAMSDVNYLVTVIRRSDMITIISSMPVTETTAKLTNTLGLQPNTRYIISVSAVTTTGSCKGQQATVICEFYACLLSGK